MTITADPSIILYPLTPARRPNPAAIRDLFADSFLEPYVDAGHARLGYRDYALIGEDNMFSMPSPPPV
jgi:hypothetical protein